MLKRTPLYEIHRQAGARLVEFGGWEMPVQYTGIVDEHGAARRSAGIFDISHMGEFWVQGEQAETFLNYALTNDVSKLKPGWGQYTLMCQEQGGVLDDLLLYRLGENEFFLIVNASRAEADFAWLQKQRQQWPQPQSVQLRDGSEDYAAIAVQGPKTRSIIDACFSSAAQGSPSEAAKPSQLVKNQIGAFHFNDRPVLISCTGYTGEDGFEVAAPKELAEPLWKTLMSEGHRCCIQPAGLGARDTLRMEACLPLYGHELTENTTPLEAGLSFAVALDKGDFIGKNRLEEQKRQGLEKKLIAFKMAQKSAPPRQHYPICFPAGGEAIGEVTSGTQSPSLGVGIGMGYVGVENAKAGTSVQIEIRGRRYNAEIAKKPLYRKTAVR